MIVVRNFNTSLSVTCKISGQKISKDTEDLNNTTRQLDSVDIYRTFLPTTVEYRFLSGVHGTFAKTEYILDNKRRLKFNRSKVIQSEFSNHVA